MITLSDVYRRSLSPRHLPRKALRRLEEALDLLDEGEYDEGYFHLLELVNRFPGSEEVLSVLVELGVYSEDWSLVARYGNKLLPYLRGEARGALLNSLIFAYSNMVYPGLAYEATQALLTQHPELVEVDEIRGLAASIEQFLYEETANLTGEAGLSSEDHYAPDVIAG